MNTQTKIQGTMQEAINEVRDQHVEGILYLIRCGFNKDEAAVRELGASTAGPKLRAEIIAMVDQILDK